MAAFRSNIITLVRRFARRARLSRHSSRQAVLVAFVMAQSVLFISVVFAQEQRAETRAETQSLSAAPTTAQSTSLMPLPTELSWVGTHNVKAFDLDLRLYGFSVANEKEQLQAARFDVRPGLTYMLLPTLEVQAKIKASMSSAYAQTQFGDFQPANGIAVQEAFLHYKPFSFFSVRAGAINQDLFSAPLLLADNAFPGVTESLHFGDRDFGFELSAEQATPTSSTLSTEAVEAEASPLFFAEMAQMSGKITSGWRAHGEVTLYNYQSLPSAVARESERFGNTVVDIGAQSGQFVYDFNGIVTGGGTEILLMRGLRWNIDGYYMRNLAAPDAYNSGEQLSTRFDFMLPGRVEVSPGAEMFFVESDAVPAFYSQSEYAGTNRTGWGANLTARFHQEDFELRALYIDSDLINPSTVQTHEQLLIVRLKFGLGTKGTDRFSRSRT
jgi:hypothetical protein